MFIFALPILGAANEKYLLLLDVCFIFATLGRVICFTEISLIQTENHGLQVKNYENYLFYNGIFSFI